MKLTVFNGSPRGKNSNSSRLLERFLKGFAETDGNEYEIHYLCHTQDQEQFNQAFAAAERVLIIFPLYTDAMPGVVMRFFETLAQFKGRAGNPPLAFFVHSGFPEPHHSTFVARYLEKLARRLGSPYLGTVIKGSSEGIADMPENWTRSMFFNMEELGRAFGRTGEVDPVVVKKITGKLRYSPLKLLVFRLLVKLPVMSMYWDWQLKKHNAYEKRFARPYTE